VWRRRSPAPWRGRAPSPPPRTAPLRRELYPYSRDSATALLRRAAPLLYPRMSTSRVGCAPDTPSLTRAVHEIGRGAGPEPGDPGPKPRGVLFGRAIKNSQIVPGRGRRRSLLPAVNGEASTTRCRVAPAQTNPSVERETLAARTAPL
jgi:hypothetical protein